MFLTGLVFVSAISVPDNNVPPLAISRSELYPASTLMNAYEKVAAGLVNSNTTG